jgi:16S rRNA (cytosine1402-N4)-methyltransferase
MGQDRATEHAGGEYHRPVMAEEVAGLFAPIRSGTVVDATFGGGGHTRKLIDSLGGEVDVVAIDRDPAAAANASALGVRFLAGDFGDLDALLDRAGVGAPAGILFDIGISSHHVDEPSRGFSYRHDGPLDMRMDPALATTAADLVNTLSEDALADLIARFGEERYARSIAASIVARRPLSRTLELAEVVAGAVPARTRREGHPARRTFQALRIAVNDELGSLRRGLEAGIARLRPGGRVVVISYHSLEDRIVKRRFVAGAAGCVCPPDLPVCGCGARPELRLLTRGALRPTPAEVAANPRARSARLRAAEKARAA